MTATIYEKWMLRALEKQPLSLQDGLTLLTDPAIELLPLLQATYNVRKQFCGNDVRIHIIDNVQNGGCDQNCSYCVQSKHSNAVIETYSMKPENQIMAEAKAAYESGAFRHCLVFSGKGPSKKRIRTLAELVKKMKQLYNMEVCVSPGFIDEEDAHILKEAGLDRINHNINTSERFYTEICTTHTWKDRYSTIKTAKKAGLGVCSGVIVGMGETPQDLVEAGQALHELNADSIPVNFFLSLDGLPLKEPQRLTPSYCLRVLCLFRLLNPETEIRVAAGREVHLRHLQALALYPANSLFMNGYLNSDGTNAIETLQMIKDAGFTIKSDQTIDDILERITLK